MGPDMDWKAARTMSGCLEVHSVQRTFVAEARAFGLRRRKDVRQAPRLLHLQLEEQLPMEAREPPEMMAFHT